MTDGGPFFDDLGDLRTQMIRTAKAIVDDHWPSPDRCPICRVAACTARGNAAYYLEVVGEPPYVPNLLTRAA
ncbi:hypothetical protein OOJ91_12400 [Micromonospora lupini]|uniref:hypothetical protein n=1 Tax=Micromonospora lupini TaxID=285679 RepID=UPI00225237D2|nr:hypothetical protein [Micromonospora lupini]MCX5066680.1 hypothetical protein [Micromonospora lupini]